MRPPTSIKDHTHWSIKLIEDKHFFCMMNHSKKQHMKLYDTNFDFNAVRTSSWGGIIAKFNPAIGEPTTLPPPEIEHQKLDPPALQHPWRIPASTLPAWAKTYIGFLAEAVLLQVSWGKCAKHVLQSAINHSQPRASHKLYVLSIYCIAVSKHTCMI